MEIIYKSIQLIIKQCLKYGDDLFLLFKNCKTPI